MKEFLLSRDVAIAVFSVIIGMFIPFIIKRLQKLWIKLNIKRRTLKVIIDDIGLIQDKAKFHKVLQVLLKKSTNFERLVVRAERDKDLLRKVPPAEIESYENDCKQQETEVKDILYLLLSEKAKKLLFYFGVEKDEEFEQVILKTLKRRLGYSVGDEYIGLDAINKGVTDSFGNSLVCVVYAKKEMIQSTVRGTGLTDKDIPIDEGLIFWSATVANVADKEWKRTEFLPNLINTTLTKVGHENIYSATFDVAKLYDPYAWILGLH